MIRTKSLLSVATLITDLKFDLTVFFLVKQHFLNPNFSIDSILFSQFFALLLLFISVSFSLSLSLSLLKNRHYRLKNL